MKRIASVICLIYTMLFTFDVFAAGSIVKIMTTTKVYNYEAPWQPPAQKKLSGSGCILTNNKIITNAHVVADATFLEVKRDDTTKFYPAKVLHIAHDCDLAILEVLDKRFFEGATPLELGNMPLVGENVTVQGFPIGGNELSTTAGVVSRTEIAECVHSGCHILMTQVDAPINPGNSGGAVLKDQKIVGIATQGIPKAQNIGYMVPVPVIERFLKDIQVHTQYKEIPTLGMSSQELENEDLRQFLQLKEGDKGGILVNYISDLSPVYRLLQEMDVIIAIDGEKIAEDGSFAWYNNQRIFSVYLIQRKLIGEKVKIDILRDGQPLSVEVELRKSIREHQLVPLRQYDVAPTYYIKGGLVFQPLTQNYLELWGDHWFYTAPTRMLYYYQNGKKTSKRQEVVVLSYVLPHANNQGYQNVQYQIVKSVDDQEVKDFDHLIQLVENGTTEFIKVTFENDGKLILNRKKMLESHQEILDNAGINFDRSLNLRKTA